MNQQKTETQEQELSFKKDTNEGYSQFKPKKSRGSEEVTWCIHVP